MISARHSMATGIVDRLRAAQLRGLRRATVYLWTQLQQTLNVPNTGTTVRVRGGGRATRYLSPSAPGEPPRKRSGFLQRSVTYEIDVEGLTSRVGPSVNATYGVHLELGTARMQARPWLLSTAKRCMPTMAQMVGEDTRNA